MGAEGRGLKSFRPNHRRVYDAAVNVTYDGVNSCLYDGKGRICAVASTPVPGMTAMTGYLYDADGTCVAKGAITTWSCDSASTVSRPLTTASSVPRVSR